MMTKMIISFLEWPDRDDVDPHEHIRHERGRSQSRLDDKIQLKPTAARFVAPGGRRLARYRFIALCTAALVCLWCPQECLRV